MIWLDISCCHLRESRTLHEKPHIPIDATFNDHTTRTTHPPSLPISAGHSVLVAAHTSAGKTVVAEYAFAMALR